MFDKYIHKYICKKAIKSHIIQSWDYFQLQKTQDAITYITKAIFLIRQENICYEDLHAIYCLRAMFYAQLDNYQCAYNDLLESNKLSPNNSETLSNIGMSLLKLGRYEEALVYCTQALEVNPKEVLAYINKGWIYCMNNSADKALECFKCVLAIDPRNIQALSNSVIININFGRYDQAVEDVKQLVHYYPKCIISYFYEGFLLVTKLVLTSNDEARISKIINAMISEHPQSHLGYYLKGFYNNRIENFSLAISSFKRAEELEPKDVRLYVQEALSYFSLKKYDEAKKCLDIGFNYICYNEEQVWFNDDAPNIQYIKHDEKNPLVYPAWLFTYSLVLFAKGDNLNSESYFNKAIKTFTYNYIQRLPSQKKYILYRYRSFNEYTMKSLENNTIWFSSILKFNDSFEGEYLRVAIDYNKFNNFFANFKVACFELKEQGGQNYYMWDQYASLSTGICIVYEFNPFEANRLVYFNKINYSEYSYKDSYSLDFYFQNCFFNKGTKWKYEKEFRLLIYNKSSIEDGIDVSADEIGLKPIKIIFGRKCSQQTELAIKKLCKLKYPHMKYAHVQWREDASYDPLIIDEE